jgi:transcriptional regulator with XRE-family HTH domain
MGRPEKPLPHGVPSALLNLVIWLRSHRREAELTYSKMAKLTDYHSTTLQRAASGHRVPRLRVLEAYASVCGASRVQARRLWMMARYEAIAGRLGPRAEVYYAPSRPELIRDMADLIPALVDLYERAGAPPLRALEQRAGTHGELPRSTVHRILHGKATPTKKQFLAWIEACGVTSGTERLAWVRAWGRIQEAELRKTVRTRQAWASVAFTTGRVGDGPKVVLSQVLWAVTVRSCRCAGWPRGSCPKSALLGVRSGDGHGPWERSRSS